MDVESYDIETLVYKINKSLQGDNEFVIVSPMQNAMRMRRLKNFVDRLGINCYFLKYLDKQQLREDKDWTCCAILCSTRNSELAAINIEEVHRKTKEFFSDVTLWSDKKFAKSIFDGVKVCAENGDAESMNFMGLFYTKGILVEKSKDEAFAWFKLAAGYEFPRAVRNLALSYVDGSVVEKNRSLAVEIINKIRESDTPLYYLSLGEIERKVGLHKAAFENFRLAAELGNARAKYYHGKYLIKGKCCDKNILLGIKNIKYAANYFVAPACLLLASLYEKGFADGEICQSNTLAVENYKSAAKGGSVKAQKKLAEIYRKGLLGEQENQKEAFKWYLIAAEQGDYDAAFYVALSYANGTGVAQNYTEAVLWYKIAANHGSSSAMNNLAVCYENGRGVEKNEEKAFSLYLKAAEEGGLMAANNVSVCYQKGTGTKINPQQALFWKEKAAEGGNLKAMGTLANWYFKGYGTERSYEKALFWFVKSKLNKEQNNVGIDNLFDLILQKANEGNVLFQYMLAKCYDYGVLVTEDLPLSMIWYEKSAENGFVESLIKLRCMELISTKATKEEMEAGVKDKFGVLYSQDWKRVLSCTFVNCKSYKIRKGTRIICDGAFINQHIEKLIIPNSVVAIGNNPFACDPYYHDTKIAIESQSSYYIVNEDALYSKDGRTIVAYWGKQKQFIIPEHVIHIANGCFSNSRNLEAIIVPQGLESIGCKAFEDCYSLKSLDLPKSVKSIGASAFWGCESLEEIWSLGSNTTIEPYTFEGCNLKYVHLPSCLVSIMDGAFKSNSELQYIDFPDTLETIGNHSFAYCDSLERINMGDSVTTIGDFCFLGCNIHEVRLPSTITSLGIRPFDNVTNIITKRDSLYKAEGGMLINTKTKNLECVFGESSFITLKDIKSISPFAFYESKVTEVVMPDEIISLPEYAFYDSQKLKNIKLSDRLEFIGSGAFCGCKNLCAISIPKSVKEIDNGAFCECVTLEMIEFKGSVTNASESIIENIECKYFPNGYHSHCSTIGVCSDLITADRPNVESFKCITIVVPKYNKNKYSFMPVYNCGMDRRFEIVESDEES